MVTRMAAAFVGGRTVQVGWLGVRDGGHQVLTEIIYTEQKSN